MSKNINHHLGQCIKALRLERGLTQVDLSERCGFYQTYLSRIENGLSNPTLNAIEIIAISLDLTIYDLFTYMQSIDHKKKKISRKN